MRIEDFSASLLIRKFRTQQLGEVRLETRSDFIKDILGIRSVGRRTSATLRGSARYAFGEHR